MAVVTHPPTRSIFSALQVRRQASRDQDVLPLLSGMQTLPLVARSKSVDTLSALADLHAVYGPFQPGSALLGVCEDGVPLLADFTNPNTGSILASAPTGAGMDQLLRFLLESIPQINTAEEVCYHVISAQPHKFYPYLKQPYCAGLSHNRSEDIGQLLEIYLATSRGEIVPTGPTPTNLLVIDDLADFIHGLDEEAFWGFTWLVHAGHLDKVYIIATQSTETLNWVDRELLEVFATRLKATTQQNNLHTQVFHVPYQDTWFSVSHNPQGIQ